MQLMIFFAKQLFFFSTEILLGLKHVREVDKRVIFVVKLKGENTTADWDGDVDNKSDIVFA